jgi:D-lyxose ketol-isomerase
MKRSEINQILRDAKALLARYSFRLPPLANWTPEEYRRKAPQCPEIRDCQLGWDVTDFGQGRFDEVGLLLFTIRNGMLNHPVYTKPYAEKIMISRVDQKTLLHYHLHKTEDIINRGGGRLVFEFYQSIPGTAELDRSRLVEVPGDGMVHRIEPGEHLSIGPGESLTLRPGLFHAFWAEEEDTVIGEVSAVNDDHTDNVYYGEQARFPVIEEDEPPLHLLVGDY